MRSRATKETSGARTVSGSREILNPVSAASSTPSRRSLTWLADQYRQRRRRHAAVSSSGGRHLFQLPFHELVTIAVGGQPEEFLGGHPGLRHVPSLPSPGR
jgi:hypothetical protein